MARRKRKSRARQSSAALRRSGLQAFKRGEYDRAIEIWERVGEQTPTMLPAQALAEAYFRRGLARLYGEAGDPEAGVSDLREAAKLHDTPRYRYHLGLAAHRRGDLEGAIRFYRQIRQQDGELAARGAYPLALALLQQGEDPAEAPVWSELTDRERRMLSQAGAFRRRPYTLADDAPLVWLGIAALDAGDHEEARIALESVTDSIADLNERQMAHYYRGVLAAQEENWDGARRQWSRARAAGLTMPRLEHNLGELYHRLAEERLAEDSDSEGALEAAYEALRHKPGDNRLRELISQIHQRLGYRAATAGRWGVAKENWESARAIEGGSFRLAYNLALTYERFEDFIAAGEMWREALRRRPRREDHTDAIDDEEVALLWRRAAEAYRKAGDYDEATRVYRHAVKYNPDHLPTRMALVEALLADGRTEAAENELNRILERDEDYIPALIAMGEVLVASGNWWRWNSPLHYWERVLELEPENDTARQLLVDYCLDEAEYNLSWGNHDRAFQMYHQALEYRPGSGRVLAALAAYHLRIHEEEAAQPHIEQALANAPADLEVYGEIIHAYLDVGQSERAWEMMKEAEANIDEIPFQFYVTQASYCIEGDYPAEQVHSWLERAIKAAPPGAPVLAMIGEMAAMSGVAEIAREYLERAIAADQSPGQAQLMLGILAANEYDYEQAEEHWEEAERIARRTGDEGLSERVELARHIFSTPLSYLESLFGGRLGPRGDIPFPDFYDDEDEDEDDDFFF